MNTAQRTARPLLGKVAMVTGGSRGIGAAVVQRLAEDGAAVAFTYANSSTQAAALVQKLQHAGLTAVAIQADAGNAEQVKSAVATVANQFGGRIDILVNNAGIGIVKQVGEFTLEDFDHIVNINVKGVFVTTQEVLLHMKPGGRIVNIGSINSEFISWVGGGLYAMTKAAVAGWTQATSRDLGLRNITINNVMPGPTNTDMNPKASDFADAQTTIALQRYAQPDEIADAVAYLASPGASYITGSNIPVAGGYGV